MKSLFLSLFLLTFTKSFCQKKLFIENRVKTYTCWRERFFPNNISAEIYEYYKFDSSGRITEKCQYYYIPGSGPSYYIYDSSNYLIQVTETLKSGEVREVHKFNNKSDSVKSRGYQPLYPVADYFVEDGWVNKIILRSNNAWIVKTDTIYLKNKHKRITAIETRKDIVNKNIFEYKGKTIRRYTREYMKDFAGLIETLHLLFNYKGLLKEKVSEIPNGEYFHFKYKYYRNGILKELKAYSKDGILNEKCWFKINYY